MEQVTEANKINWSEYLQDDHHQYLMGMPADLDTWMLCDCWGIDTACQLIALSLTLDIEKHRLDSKLPVSAPHFQALMARTICEVYDRALTIAKSSVQTGAIKEHDTPANWIKWAINKGYSVAHLNFADAPAAKGRETTPGDDWKEKARAIDHDETLAALFDPMPVEALEKMFPADGQWKTWAEKAKTNGLILAREERARFNPYKAGVWLVRKGAHGWDDARLYRTLANNLPARSKDSKYLLTGDID